IGTSGYSWINIPGETDASFTIPTTLTGGTYYYQCEISTLGGSRAISNMATVNVIVPEITINTQPAAVTNVDFNNISGSINVSASTTNNAELSYQWYSNYINSNTDGWIISGATEANFNIPTTLTGGTYYYYCLISTADEVSIPVRSNVARVIVSIPVIIINTQPTPTTNVFSGNISGDLSVAASVIGNADISYQWYRNTINNNSGGTIISGATNASYVIPTTLTAGTYYYYCRLSAGGGASPVSSSVARVNVSVPVITINTQPSPTTNVFSGNISGGNLSVGASVTGNAEIRYQWYSNTTNNNSGGTIINGAINASYVIPTSLTAGTYYYYCRLNAGGGASPVSSNVARVIVVEPIEMVQVPGGSFELGRNLGTGGGSDETPVSTVNISGFYMGKYQVTREQYFTVMGTYPGFILAAHAAAAEQVSWYDAIVFCNRLSNMEDLTPAYSISGSTNPDAWGTVPTSSNATWNAVQIVSGSTGYRLPTEAQWEYAAKGGNGSPGNFTYSGSNDPDAVAWYRGNSGNITHEVGKKAPNSLGIYDMSGNVAEWCWDWFGIYTSTTKIDPTGAPSGTNRVIRGGSWGHSSENVRSVYRSHNDPGSRARYYYTDYYGYIGFRLLRP
ncbi:MAG: formylglycine-generating enzyme family protein, partial [Treponema sp.]|nr:formylglycine-generating enzyme family protein [Treponema sp.]